MTVRDYHTTHAVDGIAVLSEVGGEPGLWIEAHGHGLTVVDTNASAAELLYRDESDVDVDVRIAEWKKCVE